MTPAEHEAEAPASPGPGASVLHMLQALWLDLPGLVSDRVHLLTLELKRAGAALALMLGLVIGAAVLGATAWVALWVGITAALLQWGLAWGWVFLIVLVLNLGGALFALLRAKSLAHLLGLPATVRRLTVAPAMVSAALRPEAAAGTPPRAYEPARSEHAVAP
jgi:uncharacterized membrane protein YqjE